MENIIEKLKQINPNNNSFDNWSLEEKLKLLEMYYIISKKESYIFDLIYSHHGCDCWEDIFRDYKIRYFKDKADGVDAAIEDIKYRINRNNE